MKKEYVKSVSLTKIKPYHKNPRIIKNNAIDFVLKSISKNGYISPIIVDENNTILCGHTRILALKKLNKKECDIIKITGLTEKQKKDFRIMDNKSSELADWDFDALQLDFKPLELKEFGFDLQKDFGIEPEPDAKADIIPEVDKKNVICKTGDLWQLGKHRLLCGDSTKEDDVKRLMDGKKADMVFTDPPYALFGNSTGVSGVVDDNMVRPFFKIIMISFQKNTKKFGHIYMCCDWHSAFSIESCARSVDLQAKNMCIWDKGDGGVGAMYQQCYEIIWFFDNSPKNKTTMNTVESGVRVVNGKPNIWRFKRVTSDRMHNAQKPIDLIELPISCGCKIKDIVLDLFLGSGSTLIACEKTDRVCYSCEIDEYYCDVAIKRWEDYTGKKAKLLKI